MNDDEYEIEYPAPPAQNEDDAPDTPQADTPEDFRFDDWALI